MSAVLSTLASKLSSAVATAFGSQYGELDPELRAATKPEFGHFQTNLALRLAKSLGLPPRTVAEQLVAALDLTGLCEPASIAGPGFVNLTLLPETLAAGVNEPEVFAPRGERVVVDYSQPNVAKQMHVGHLRSTVIGDALCNVLRYVGYEVIRQNHVGDWGTQFGMMVEQVLFEGLDVDTLDIEGLQQLYQRARKHFDADSNFVELSRARVVLLQSGDSETLAIWRQMVVVSLVEFDRIYAQLGSPLMRADVVGESAYNDRLQGVVDDLDALGLLTESGGAQCAFLPGFVGRDGLPLPVIVRKSDGGFGYSATDLAAVRHRIDDLQASRIVYVVDHRQALHFQQIFALCRAAALATRISPRRTCCLRHRLGPGRQTLQNQRRRHRPASPPPRRRNRPCPGSPRRPRCTARVRPGRGRCCSRHRRHQVRRPRERPHQRLHLRPRPHGRHDRQHRSLPAIRPRQTHQHPHSRQ